MDKELENQMSPEEETTSEAEVIEEETVEESVDDASGAEASEGSEDAEAETETEIVEDADQDSDVVVADEFDEDTDIPEPPKSSNKGLIIATIIVVVMIVAFFVVYFFFNPKVTPILNGTWASGEDSDYAVYFVFEDNKAYYMSSGYQVDYDVKYISEENVELIYTEDGYTKVLGIKPEFSEDGKTLEFVGLYTTEDYGYTEDNKNVIISLTKSDKTASDLGVERNRETTTESTSEEPETTVPNYENNMSDKVKKSIQGIWAMSASDDEEAMYIKIDGDKVKYGTASNSMEGKTYYPDDETFVMYFEEDSYNTYLVYSPSVKDNKLTLTPVYQIANGYKYEATDEDKALVLEKTDKEPTTAKTTEADDEE